MTQNMDNMSSQVDRILDPDEYHQKRRIKELMDARKEVRKTKIDIEGRKYNPKVKISNFEACQYYRTILTSYLQELQPLMTITYPETGTGYWEELDLGKTKLHPPEKIKIDDRPGRLERNQGTNVINDPDPEVFEINGLRSIVQYPSPLTAKFTLEVNSRRGIDTETYDRTTTAEINWGTLELAYQQANQFLADVGLTLDPEDELPVHDLG